LLLVIAVNIKYTLPVIDLKGLPGPGSVEKGKGQ
jgi:hypothetical protein